MEDFTSFKGFWHENDGTKTPHEELDVSSYELNYTFGDTLTFTIGSIFHAEGTAKIYGSKVTLFYYLFRKPITFVRQLIGI